MSQETNRPPMAVILAVDAGSRLHPLTDDCPKSLLSVGGSAILERVIRNCLSCGISQFVLVLGHRSDLIQQFVHKTFRGIRITYVINSRYRNTNADYSLMLASSAIGAAEFIKFDTNVVFDIKILRHLVDSDLPNLLCIDRNIVQEDEKVVVVADDQMRVLEVGKSVDPKTAMGVSIGIEKISSETGQLMFAELAEMAENPKHQEESYEAAYSRLVTKGTTFHALDVTGLEWTDINTAEDLVVANTKFGSPIKTVSRAQELAQDEAIGDATALT